MIDASLLDLGLGAVGAVAVVGLIASLRPSQRRRRQARATAIASAPTGTVEQEEPISELDRRSSAALVAADNRLAGAEQELAFAQAQFGSGATDAFASVLTDSRARLTEAFGLRQRVDDDTDSDADRRTRCERILSLCSAIADDLSAQENEFANRRARQDGAAATLDDVEAQATQAGRRIAGAQATLTALAAQLPPGSLSTLAANPDHAEQLLTAAAAAVAAGRSSLRADDKQSAASQARIAVAGLSQAIALVDAIDSAQSDLASAPERIATRLSSLGTDLRDVSRLAPDNAGIAPLAADARAAIARAQHTDADPLAALADLQKAEAALDSALAPIRRSADEDAKTLSALTAAIGSSTAAVNAVGNFISTRQGAVGAEARTRLSEARRLLNEAQTIERSDPGLALAKLRQADAGAEQAAQLAQVDVDRWEDREWLRDGAKFVTKLVLGDRFDDGPFIFR